MAAIEAASLVVGEFCAEFLGDREVFGEVGVSAVAVLHEQGGGGDVFGYPVGITSCTVEGGGEGGCGAEVGDGAWEAVLEDAGWVYGRDCWVFGVISADGCWRWRCGSCWVFRDGRRWSGYGLCFLTSSSSDSVESSSCRCTDSR